MNNYNTIKVKRPKSSRFNLSYSKLFTAKMGLLYPVLHDVCLPGDFWKIGNQMVIRFLPMVAPILHEINAYVHYFFVPFRLVWPSSNANGGTIDDPTDGWIPFLTGGKSGNIAPTPPKWTYTPGSATQIAEDTLYDHFGFQPTNEPAGVVPSDLVRRAYLMIWNEYYRDVNHQTMLDITNSTYFYLQTRCWEKDYFTSALPWQQRGTAPAMPVTGLAQWDAADFYDGTYGGEEPISFQTGSLDNLGWVDDTQARANALGFMNANSLVTTSFDIADLRLAFQVQRLMETSARVGSRYNEFLRGIYCVAPHDETLQRPQYVGGSKCPIIVSEVLQTSKSEVGAPQGNLAGHGIAIDGRYCGKYFVREPGVIMGIMSIMPRAVYQTGNDRQWLFDTRYDYPLPQLVNLSEQPIFKGELFVTNADSATNAAVFGYQGRFDEHRSKRNLVCGAMRSSAATPLDYWHLARDFASVPTLGSTFIKCNSSETERIFAVEEGPNLVVHFLNRLNVVRPLPYIATPGLIDH